MPRLKLAAPPPSIVPDAVRAEVEKLPLLLSQEQAIKYSGMSRSNWFRARSAGQLPKPVSVAGSSRPFWRTADLQKWAERLRVYHAPRRAAGD